MSKKFAHYQILEKLGQGGMGAVYKARDTKIDRLVALKVISVGEISEKDIARFLQEAKATAALEHPNIVQFFEIGEVPQNYFTMEYIPGENLQTLTAKKKLRVPEIVTMGKKIAEAIAFAHGNGIIHRDIKPANVMVMPDKEIKVMDFGLAKLANVRNSLSKTGDILGTPAYMAPEQAEGGKIDFRADIYSIGATLYEALTQKPPFEGESYLSMLNKVFNEEVVRPRSINPHIPVDIETIVLKCLEKIPAHRYQSAQELAIDLQKFIQYKPIVAKPISKQEKWWRFLKRNRALGLALTICTIVILFMLIITWHYQAQANAERYEKIDQYLSQAKTKRASLQKTLTIAKHVEILEIYSKVLALERENEQALKGKFAIVLQIGQIAVKLQDYELAHIMFSLAYSMKVDKTKALKALGSLKDVKKRQQSEIKALVESMFANVQKE